MRNNQKRGITHSFQFQIIAYTLISLALTAVTMLFLSLAVYAMLALLRLDAGGQEVRNAGPRSSYSNLDYAWGTNQSNMTVPADKGPSDGMGIVGRGGVTLLVALSLSLSLFFFILYFLLLTRKFTAYLEEITGGIKRLATGEFDTRIEVRQANELTEIARNFNMMAGDLERIMNEERKNESAKNELITSVAHDLRTPLTSVIGYLELVAEKDLPEGTRSHYISVAYRKAKRMKGLIEDLFSYTQYGSGELPMNLARIDAIKMMEQLLEEFYPNIQESQLELGIEKKADSAMVDADGLLLARAFANLLGNAIKYGRDGKNLKVRMEKEERDVVLRITNFGEVIPEKDLENIFRRFYRVDSARMEAQGGTGLGLAIAKNIIELHSGTISVKSDLDGTEFTVRLPLAG